jgi:putative ABC transport system substrate-binding protein
MATASEPVTSGLVGGLARPGGTVTGVSNLASQLTGKRLELLKEAAPSITCVAFLWNPALPDRAFELPEADAAARALGLELRSLAVREASEFDGAFAQAMGERVQALLLQENALNFSYQARIADFATQSRLPSMGGGAMFVGAGGFMSYGPNLPDQHRRAAYYVDRILKGTRPADLPVEQPMTFEFVVNLKTAQALGITFPNEIMLQVTEVIQ